MSQLNNDPALDQGMGVLATQEPITDVNPAQLGPYPSPLICAPHGGSGAVSLLERWKSEPDPDGPIEGSVPRMEMSGGSNLETALQEFATALENERTGLWEAAWSLHRVLGTTSLKRTKEQKKELRATIGAFAQVGNCTGAWIVQLWTVGEVFPDAGSVYQDHSISWHRKVAQRAKALGRSTAGLAEEADQKGWSQSDLDQLGKAAADRAHLEATCKECSASVSIKAKGLKGLIIPCPVCVGIKYEGVPDRPYEGFLGRLG